jgi:hypothetical protein
MLTVSACPAVEKRDPQKMDRPKSVLERSTVPRHKPRPGVSRDGSVDAIRVVAQSFSHDFAAPNCVDNHR